MTVADSEGVSSTRWRDWFARVPVAAAGFTALCCLGFSAALSLATAMGASFLTEYSTLRPILAVTLTSTVAVSALTYWRHREPGPLLVTTIAAVWVYAGTYLIGDDHGESSHAGDLTGHGAQAGGLSGGQLVFVWIGLVLLVAAQVWDLVRIRSARSDAAS